MVQYHNIFGGIYYPGDHEIMDIGVPAGDQIAPAQPASVSPTAANTVVSLNWADSADSDFGFYKVYQSTTAGGPYTEIATTPTSDYEVTGLTNGTPYYFVITAVDSSGNESIESDETSGTPVLGGDTTPPDAPTGLVATAGDAQVVLAWDDNVEGDLANYRVYRGTVTGGPYTRIAVVPDSAYTAVGLTNGTEYFFVVTAVDTSLNESAESNEDSDTPTGAAADVTAPAVPTGLGAVAGAGQVALNWADNAEGDFSHYKVYRATASGGPYNLISSPSASLYTDTAITGGTQYWYKVSALDVTGNESAQTSSVTGTPTTPSGVNIPAGASIQAYVNANPNGTTFSLSAGTYSNQTVTPKTGNVFIGALGSGGTRLSIMDGQNSAQYAFALSSPANVTLRNLIIHNYNSPLQHGAVGGPRSRSSMNDTGWTVDNCEVRYCNGAGIYAGSGWIVRNSFIHHNGQIGIKALGTTILYENCEVSFNNAENNVWGHEAGGSKFVGTNGLTVRGCYVHDNNGPGLWTDINNINVIYENNRSIDNVAMGIFHEISFSCIIRNNIVQGNGPAPGSVSPYVTAGIVISASEDVEIHNNTVTGNANGIVLMQQNRGPEGGHNAPYVLRDVNTHDNVVSGGRTGAIQDVGDNAIFTSRNNTFENNDYSSTVFVWQNADKTFAQWQAYGHDDTGSYT